MDKVKFNLCVNALGPSMDEFVEAIAWGLGEFGYECTIKRATVTFDAVNILFAGGGQDLGEMSRIAPKTIVFNLEQMGDHKSQINSASYFALMRHFPTWEYSRKNMSLLPQYGVSELHHVPIGYVPVLERIAPAPVKDIDVLFYGSKNDRRYDVFDAIKAKGLNMVYNEPFTNWTREERDALIARSKLVLNVGFFDDVHIFEEVRVSYLLNNKICVVSELRDDTIIEDDMRQCCAFAKADQIAQTCVELCNDEAKRNEIAQRGYDIFKKREFLAPLKLAVDSYVTNHKDSPRALKPNIDVPKKLNIGSGRKWKYDYFNLDLDTTRGSDIVFDLSEKFDFDAEHQTWRFGNVKIPKGHFDYILSEHIFEHVPNLIQCMTTCLDWLCDGGILEVEVPYDLSHGAWQDPTHIRGFNERSWGYYCVNDCWYVGWRTHVFDLISQIHILEPLGSKLQKEGMHVDDVIRVPRAVYGLRVKLRKRELTDAEKRAHEPYFRTVTVDV
ncbi:MAG: hypothetical protein FD163_2 [Hyphomonadaceae bacterium]|nr:MAG: hypothetical protein FD163_2 [Hyphomonadaceae bacterium]